MIWIGLGVMWFLIGLLILFQFNRMHLRKFGSYVDDITLTIFAGILGPIVFFPELKLYEERKKREKHENIN